MLNVVGRGEQRFPEQPNPIEYVNEREITQSTYRQVVNLELISFFFNFRYRQSIVGISFTVVKLFYLATDDIPIGILQYSTTFCLFFSCYPFLSLNRYP